MMGNHIKTTRSDLCFRKMALEAGWRVRDKREDESRSPRRRPCTGTEVLNEDDCNGIGDQESDYRETERAQFWLWWLGYLWGSEGEGQGQIMIRFPACMTSWIMPIMHVFRENNKISLVWNYLGGREICGLRSETLAKDTDVKACRAQKTVRLEWGLEGE